MTAMSNQDTIPSGIEMPSCHKHGRPPTPMDSVSYGYTNGVRTVVYFSCPRCYKIISRRIAVEELGEQLALPIDDHDHA